MAAAVAVGAFAPMTVKASEEGLYIFSYEHDKEFLEEIMAIDFIADLTNPNNQWIDTEDELKYFLGLEPYDNYNIDYDTFTYYDRGNITATSPYTDNSIYSIYQPFFDSNYVVGSGPRIWVPEGLKFHVANVWSFESTGYINVANYQYFPTRGYIISALLNQEGKKISHFEKGMNYIVNFMPILYDENAYGMIVRNVIRVHVTSFDEAIAMGYYFDEPFTNELINQYILAEEY